MRHRVGGFKLQRDGSARRALLRGLTTSLIMEDRIVTTVTKAKAVRPHVERMITLAKRDTLHSRRQAASFLNSPEALKKLFEKLGPRFSERPGGYTRILRLGPRQGDGAEKALIELLGSEIKRKAEERKKRREERIKEQEEQGEAAES
ncbi:MAG: 50S ribosomal protein L17 [Acidobacteria bacterium]|nr:50S ribosomal protein L17 [Acidobacteriota bacterium]